MYTSYQYTKNVGSLFQDAISQAKTFYCREDFADVIKRYKKAPKDSKEFIRKELDGMCEARGLDTWMLLRDSKALDTIPTRSEILEQLQERFAETFYNLRKNIPSAHDYIKRLVYRLAPEYADDTVRVAILKKYVLGAGTDCSEYDTSSVIRWAVLRMNDSERKAYTDADQQTQLKMVVQKLDDSIFCKEHMTSELNWKDILVLILRREKRLSGTKVINDAGNTVDYPQYKLDAKMLNEEATTVCRFLELAETGQCSVCEMINALIGKFENLDKATAENCQNPATPPSDQELSEFAALLEKKFKQHLNSFTYWTQTGSKAKLGLQYREDVRYARRQRQEGKWEILTTCNDLAQGAFKTNNRQTRVKLYHFAMMFDMTFSKKREDMDPNTDIRKNLFEDYYCDNLVRYLGQSPLNLKESSGWEKEPSGEGINWKNYAEVVYLYYLHRKDSRFTAGQKINRAEQKIQSCKKDADTRKTQTLPNEYTQYYTDVFFDVILEADEEDLCKLILANYPIHGDGATPIQKASYQSTASEFLEESLEFLERGRETDYALDGIDKYRQDQIDEIVETTSISFDWGLEPILKERYGNDTDFIRLIENLRIRLTDEYDWVGGRKKAMLAWVLQALYHHSSVWEPIRMERLGKIVEQRDPASNGTAILEAVQTLQNLGFDIHQLSGSDESVISWKSITPILSARATYRNVVRAESIAEWMEQEAKEIKQAGTPKRVDQERIHILLQQLEAKNVIAFKGASEDRLICWNEPNTPNILDSFPVEEALGYAIVKNTFDVLCAIDDRRKEDHIEDPALREKFQSAFSGDFHFIKQKELINQVCRMMPDVDSCHVTAGINYMLKSKLIFRMGSNQNRFLCWSVPIASRQDEVLKRLQSDEETFRDAFLHGLQRATDNHLELTSPKHERIISQLIQYESSHNSITLVALLQELQKAELSTDRDCIVACVNRLNTLGEPISAEGSYETLINWAIGWDEEKILEDFSKEQSAELAVLDGVIGFLSNLPREQRTVTGQIDHLVADTRSTFPESNPTRVLRAVDYLATAGVHIRIEDGTFIWERAYHDKAVLQSARDAFAENLPTEKDFAERLLTAMAVCNFGQCAIRMCELKKLLAGDKKLGGTGELLDAVKKLTALKVGIRKVGSGESLFYLGARKYAQEKMNRILKKVETRYEPDIAGLRKLFSEMLAEAERSERKVTRTTVLSICMIHYVEMLSEATNIQSFPALYDDFVAYVNPFLLDCRFQPLHEKNILDMYVILSLFFYVTKNGHK